VQHGELSVLAVEEPGILSLAGKYADDPTYLEAARLGREWRDQVNRESLEEFDREEAEEKRKAADKAKATGKAKARKPKARSRGTNGRA